jgi:phage terminase large subunit-like protein
MLIRAMVRRLDKFGIELYMPYEKQRKAHEAEEFFRIMWGGNSSGKTYFAVAECCMHLSGIYPPWFPEHNRYDEPIDVWICLEDYDSFEDTHKPYIENHIGPLISSYNSQSHKMEFKTGTTLHVKSYRSGVDAFKSSEIGFIYLDEEPPEDIMRACRARIVRVKNGKILCTITPISGPQWFFRVLEKAKENPDYFQIQANMDDNKSLTKEDKRKFAEGIEDERERKVRVEGEAVALIGHRVFEEEPLDRMEEFVEEPKKGKLHWRDDPVDQPAYEMEVLEAS